MRLAPFMEARSDMDDLFSRLIGEGPTIGRTGQHEVPTDVFHLDNHLVIRMDLPGVDASDVEVTVQDNVLLINGSRPFPFDGEQVRFVRRGAFYGDFTQRVMLGKGLRLDGVSAHYDSGVLELKIPYAEEVQPRKIDIQLGNGTGRSLES